MSLPRTWLSRGLKALKPWGAVRPLAAGVLLMGGGALYLAHTQEANLGSPPISERAEAESTAAGLDAVGQRQSPLPGDSPPANRDTYDLSLFSETAQEASTIAGLDAAGQRQSPLPGDRPPANRDTYDLSLWDLPGDYPGAGAETVSAPDIPELAHLWDGHKRCYHTYDEHPLGQNVC